MLQLQIICSLAMAKLAIDLQDHRSVVYDIYVVSFDKPHREKTCVCVCASALPFVTMFEILDGHLLVVNECLSRPKTV